MHTGELQPLKVRWKSDLRGWWLLIALVVVFAAMIWTSSMEGQGPFALAIMLGLAGFGALLGAYINARRPEFLFEVKGLYIRSLGRSLDWENVKKIKRENEEVLIDVLEEGRAWRMPIDLNSLRLNPKSLQKLDAWLTAGPQSEIPISNTSQTLGEYAVKQGWAGNMAVAALMSLFVALALAAIAWSMPGVGLVFSPFGFILGMLISMLLPGAKAAAVRANFHSLWVMPTRSIPWSAVADIKLADARKNRIQIDLLGGQYEDGQGVLESPVLIDISKVPDTGDEILDALNRIFRPDAGETPPQVEYRPNAYTKGDLFFSAATVLILVFWGSWGVWVDDLMMPAKRSTLHLHGVSAWLMYTSWLLAALSFVAIIVDHFDKRNNEKNYKRIGQSAVLGAWMLFFGALTVSFVQPAPDQVPSCVTRILKAVDSSDGARTAYAYVFECRGNPAKFVNVSVLPKGTVPTKGRPNVATVGWPGKFSDLRWEGEKLQLVHAYPWKLRPAKGAPVVIRAVPR
jgi:hypothetical protein